MGASTTTGTITIGGTAQTGAITLGSSSGSQTLNLGTGGGASTVNIANGTNGNTISIGNGANTVAQTINIGAGASAANNTINIGSGVNTAGAMAVTIGSNTNLVNTTIIQGGNGTGAITLTPQTTGTIVIGASAGTGAITVGSSSAAQTINIAAGTGAATVNIAGGGISVVNQINIGTGTATVAGGNTINIGTTAPTGLGTNIISIGASGTNNGNGIRFGSSRILNAESILAVTAITSITPTVTQILDAGIFLITSNLHETLTMPTAQGATGLVQALPSAVVGDVFRFVVSYNGTGTITLLPGTGVTIANSAGYLGPVTRTVYCQVTSITAGLETISCY